MILHAKKDYCEGCSQMEGLLMEYTGWSKQIALSAIKQWGDKWYEVVEDVKIYIMEMKLCGEDL